MQQHLQFIQILWPSTVTKFPPLLNSSYIPDSEWLGQNWRVYCMYKSVQLWEKGNIDYLPKLEDTVQFWLNLRGMQEGISDSWSKLKGKQYITIYCSARRARDYLSKLEDTVQFWSKLSGMQELGISDSWSKLGFRDISWQDRATTLRTPSQLRRSLSLIFYIHSSNIWFTSYAHLLTLFI